MEGQEFLRKYGGSTDTVTTISPHTTYNSIHDLCRTGANFFPVLSPTKHPIYENHRIKLFIAALSEISNDTVSMEKLNELGEMMYESHNSYSACGMGSPHTDLLVNLVRKMGTASDLYLFC